MKYWVFTIGLTETPPTDRWLADWQHHVTQSWFAKTKRPISVSGGDRAIVYGAGGAGFLAAVEVLSTEPQPNRPGEERFPWVLEHRLLAYKPANEHVASPAAAGIEINRIKGGPHTAITARQYRAAARLLSEMATRSIIGDSVDGLDEQVDV